MDDKHSAAPEPIAVVGLSLRCPGDATSPSAFWDVLCQGRSARSEIPPDRFDKNAFHHADHTRLDSVNTRHAHFMKKNIKAFDAPFFRISHDEAAIMDPQQRGLLEVTYQALENGGLTLEEMAGSRTSVYTASFARDHDTLLSFDAQTHTAHQMMGTTGTMLANRISYFFDLKGPSFALDSACSSGVYAIHLACESLRTGESTASIVGGSNIMLSPESMMIPLSNAGILSPDGISYSFDHRANGYSRGEGIVVVVLKSLRNAIKDGNVIRGVICASGLGHDGMKPSLTAPSTTAQEILIRDVYTRAQLSPSKTGFIEAHGTGTQIGDPREASIIGRVFGEDRAHDNPIIVGALKSNFGHLEGASGIAALVKTCYILETGLIPPNIWFEKVNPAICTESLKIKFPASLMTWPREGLRQASISNYGFGGTNAHLIVQDAFHYLKKYNLPGVHQTVESPPHGTHISESRVPSVVGNQTNGVSGEDDSASPQIVIFSAADEDGPVRQAHTLQSYIQGQSQEVYDCTLYTLSEKRSRLPWRAYAIHSKDSADELGISANLVNAVRPSKPVPNICFAFTGQGAQWPGMGKELTCYEPFRESLDAADAYLSSLGFPWSVKRELLHNEVSTLFHNPALSQPVSTCLQIALIELMWSWKIMPSHVIGHSSGEIAAAFCAGAITRESAWKIAYYRGLLSETLIGSAHEPAGMMAVALSAGSSLTYVEDMKLESSLFVGCMNSEQNTTLTGTERSIDQLKAVLDDRGIFARKLTVNVAYHSRFMSAVADEYANLIGDLDLPQDISSDRDDAVAFFSSTTGDRIPLRMMRQKHYWVQNLICKVDFLGASKSLSEYCKEAGVLLVEIGPHAVLQRPLKDNIERMIYTSALRKGINAMRTALEVAGTAFNHGHSPDMVSVNRLRRRTSPLRTLTDLPDYPFRETYYWKESRLFENSRLRKTPKHELLGAPAIDWIGTMPKWRHIIKMTELPWTRDHAFNDQAVYPAAGYVVMVVEAARRTVNDDSKIAGYLLRHVEYQKPLLIPQDAAGVEVEIIFSRTPPATALGDDWWVFQIFGFTGANSTRICQGYVRAELNEPGTIPRLTGVTSEVSAHDETHRRCNIKVNNKQFYQNLIDIGFQYGETFQQLTNVRYNKSGEATARLCLNSQHFQDCVIHPTTLDSITHLEIAAISEGGWKSVPTMVASRTQEIYISHDLLTSPDETILEGSASISFYGYREVDCTIRAVHAETRKPMVILKDHRATATGNYEQADIEHKILRKPCYTIDWKPSLSLARLEEQRQYFTSSFEKVESLRLNHAEANEALSAYFIQKFAPKIASYTPSQPHLKKYIAWLLHHAQKIRLLPDTHPYSSKAGEQVLANVDPSNPLSNMVATVGHNLPDILAETIDPLELFFKDSLATDFYAAAARDSSIRIAQYLDILCHEKPALKILEIGAGTGSLTREIITTLTYETGQGDTIPRFSRYFYTDISPAFFEKAREQFSSISGHMHFEKVDISHPPDLQRLGLGTFDVIVCGSVLHATKDVRQTLRNIAQLLRSGGKLIVSEQTNMSFIADNFIFGVLPGWWLSEETDRQESPLVSEETWNSFFCETGFTGTELCLRDSKCDEPHKLSVMITTLSTADQLTDSLFSPPIIIVVDRASKLQVETAQHLENSITASLNNDCHCAALDEVFSFDLHASLVIFLVGLKLDVSKNDVESDFMTIRSLCTQSRHLLWVTTGSGIQASNPNTGVVLGIARTVCSERGQQAIAVLDVSPSSIGSHIADLAFRSIQTPLADPAAVGYMDQETEYVEKDGLLHIARVVPSGWTNDTIDLIPPSSDNLPTLQLSSPVRKHVYLTIGSPGVLETLRFEEESSSEALEDEDVEIEVMAAALSLHDVAVVLGHSTGNALGCGASGVVTRAGTGSHLMPGQRVFCQAVGTQRSRLRCHTAEVWAIPPHLSFIEAAGWLSSFAAAYYALVTIGRVNQGDVVLIQNGSDAIGQAALQVAGLKGAKSLVVVATQGEKDHLVNTFHVAAGDILLKQELCQGHVKWRGLDVPGVDIMLELSQDDDLQDSMRYLKPFGHYINLSSHNSSRNRAWLSSNALRNFTYSCVGFDDISRQSKPLLEKIMSECMVLLHDHPELWRAPQTLRVFAASEVHEAFAMARTGNNTGTIVIEYASSGSEITYRPLRRKSYKFAADSSYVVAGGLGGVGRSIIRWMVSKGARYFIIPRRQLEALGQTDSTAFFDEIEQQGGRIEAPVCDITDADVVQQTLRRLTQTMPAVKGCIQATMVIQDGLFETLSMEQFHTVMAPKVAGTWNLHNHLPSGLDFFIMLSSTAGVVGNQGQSNYAAGNVFQDTFARYRVAQGQKATSLNLGLMLGIGFAAEHIEITKSMQAAGMTGIREEQLLAMLDVLCDPKRPLPNPEGAQILLGLDTPETLRRNGSEEVSAYMLKPLFRNLHNDTQGSVTADHKAGVVGEKQDHLGNVRAAENLAQAADTVAQALVTKLSRTLSVAEGEIDPSNPLYMVGIDSLLAVEVRAWILRQFQVEVAVFEILNDAVSLVSLCRKVAGQVRGKEP